MVLSQQAQLSLQNDSHRNMPGVAAHPICLIYVGQRRDHSSKAVLNHLSLLTELKTKALLESAGLGHHLILGKSQLLMYFTTYLYYLEVMQE